jgi:chromosome partitioning protein
MGKIIAIFNQKGGVGKTTTEINLGTYVALMKRRVLIVDIDPQGNTTSGLGINKRELETSTYDILIGDDVTPSTVVQGTGIRGLDIIPASIDLAGAEVELVSIEGRERRLKKALSELRDDYDYILIDCPPSLGLLTINALTAADSVMIPIQCEFFALEGVSQLLGTVEMVKKGMNPDIEIEGVLLSMFDGRTNLSLQVAQEVKKHFGNKVYSTVIPKNVRLAEAPSYGLPIAAYDPSSKGARAYQSLAEEFLRREEN